MKRILSIVAAGLLLCMGAAAAPAQPDAKKMARLVETNLDFAARQAMLMFDSVKDLPGELPNQTDREGKFVTCRSHSWVSGFHPGLLWYIYENTGDKNVMEAADILTRRITKEQYNKDSHDVGFMLNCSFGNGYRLTGSLEYINLKGMKFISAFRIRQMFREMRSTLAVVLGMFLSLQVFMIAENCYTRRKTARSRRRIPSSWRRRSSRRRSR